MPISTPDQPAGRGYAYALVDPAAGEITIVAETPHDPLAFPPDHPLGWKSEAALALADAGFGMLFDSWVPAGDGRYAMGVRRVEARLSDQLRAAIDAGRRAGTLIVEERQPGIRERNGPAAVGDPLAELRAAYLEWDEGGASSNDIEQALDDFLTQRGYPTVLYRERPRRQR